MKILLLATLLTSLSINAKEASQPKLEARCYQWGLMAGLEVETLDIHLALALKSIDKIDAAVEVGYSEGFVVGKRDTDIERKKFAYLIYSEYCLASI